MVRRVLQGLILISAVLLFSTYSLGQYVGATKCRTCHLAQSKSWQTTKMANAFELLKPGVAAEQKQAKKLDPNKDYTKDPECVGCHTTGHGKPGGFKDIESTPNLAGIQCEACHGAGDNYLKPELMSLKNKEYKRRDLIAAGLLQPDAKVCEACHNQKSPFFKGFDYQARKAQGVHQHVPLKYPHE